MISFRTSTSCSLVAALSLALLAGCGGSTTPRVYSVTGTVNYKSQPVAGAQVMFTSADGRVAEATTDAAGKFSLTTYKPGDGALPGKHKVTVVKNVPKNPSDPYSEVTSALPARYANAANTPEERNVSATEKNEFNIELTDG